jgi:hypothetical protein
MPEECGEEIEEFEGFKESEPLGNQGRQILYWDPLAQC